MAEHRHELCGVATNHNNTRLFLSNNVLSESLYTAREIGDSKIEEDCLREIICRAEIPGLLMDQLGRLQLAGVNRVWHISTCISKYLLAINEAYIRKLLQVLEHPTTMIGVPNGEDTAVGLLFPTSLKFG